MAGYFKLSISLTLFVFMIMGIHDLIINIFPNNCEMTYMFQYPQYIELKIPQYSQKNSSNYKLFVYGEGRYAQTLEKGKFTGIPVLFIPGNAGSHKQVRSLASVAYRMALDRKMKFHFNFFSVGINEDFGGLFGPVLYEQAHFVAYAIRTILGLYENSATKPDSVILVGHSLGGMVARAAVTLPEIPASFVPLIISLATPHSRPALISDPKISSFYHFVNEYWMHEKESDLKNIALVSIGSGRNDYQISSSLTSCVLADIDTTTMTVPECWLTTDHQAIVWCRQLVLAITRALFDSVDPKTSLIVTSKSNLIKAFNYQLTLRSGSKYLFKESFPETLTQLELNGQWTEILKRQYHYEVENLQTDHFIMIPLNKGVPNYRHLTIVATEIDWKNWVFVCQANVLRKNVKQCSSGVNLSGKSRVIPAKGTQIILDTEPLVRQGHSHVVVWIQPNNNEVSVDFDMNDGSNIANVSAPSFIGHYSPIVVVEKTPEKALSYNLTVKDLNQVSQAYSLLVKSIHCQGQFPIVSYRTSWGKGHWEYYLSRNGPSSYPLEFDVVPITKNESDFVDVHIILDPECTYKISLKVNYIGVFRRMALFYGNQFLSFCVCHFLLALAYQFRSLEKCGKSYSTLYWLFTLTPMVVVPFIKLLSYFLLKMDILADSSLLALHGIDMAVLPIVLFLALLPLSLLIALISWAAVILSGKTVHSFARRILRRALRTGDVITDVAAAGLMRVPVVVGVALAALSVATCGAVGLVLATGFYFIRVFKFYEDYLGHLLWSIVPGSQERRSQGDHLTSINIHFTLMILQGLSSLFHLPSLIMWAKNGPGALHPSDPSLITLLFSIVSLSLLWQYKHFSLRKLYYKQLGYLIHAFAVLVLLFGSVTIYRASYFINCVFIIVVLHQTFAPLGNQAESSQIEDQPITMNLVDSSQADSLSETNEGSTISSTSNTLSSDSD